MAKDVEVDSKSGNCEDETVKKSLSTNSNRAKSYLTPDAK